MTRSRRQVDGPAPAPVDALLFDVHPAVFWTADADGRLTIASRVTADRLGLTQADNAPDAQIALVHPEDRGALAAATRQARADGNLLDAEVRMRLVDGSYRWMRLRALFDRGAQRWHGSAEDVHDRHEAEAALRIANERLALALEGNNAWAWELDIATGRFWYSEGWKSVLGYQGSEISQDLSDFAKLVHPDDQAMLVTLHRAHLAGEISVFEADYRLRTRDDNWVWVHDRGRATERDADGRAIRAIGVRTDISARKRAEAQARKSEARFRGVFESGIVGMCIFDSASGETLAVNDRLLEMTGATRAVFDRGEWDWKKVTPVEMSALDADAIAQIVRRGAFVPYEKAFVRPDGTRIDIRLSSAPMPGQPGQVAAFIEDVTDRKRSQDRLRESESRLEAIIDSLEEGVIAIGPDDRLLFANGAFRRMIAPDAPQTARIDTLGDVLAAFELVDLDGVTVPTRRRPMPLMLHGGAVPPTEAIARFADGREIHVVYRGQPILDDAGKIRLAILVVRDVTRERQADAHLKALQQELIAVSRVSAMGTMAGSLAHELNQPLAAVANYSAAAQMMLATPDASLESVASVLKRVADEAVRAGQIVNRLRRFITKGEVERQPESLAAIVEEAVAIANGEALARATHVRLRLDRAADVVLVDRIQLQQVVFNLVRNAVEAMAGQARPALTITSRPVGDQIELLLADRGPGLPAEVAERLFEPFITTKESGMGIGLPICRSIIRAHGGDIRAEPRPRGGTVFIVSLPRPDPV